jgi:type II secretory ATPase GspE/PulE/Tfp pilus assembly ATPase PilB-like protein
MKRLAIACGLFLCAAAALASEVQLKSGRVLSNVTILSRTPTTLEIHVQYGDMSIPLSDIVSIDGVALPTRPVAPKKRLEFTPSVTETVVVAVVPVVPVIPYVHNWSMDLLLAGMAVVFGLWIAMVLWVQSDATGTAAEIKRANADVLLLPGLGLVLYFFDKAKQAQNKEARKNKKDTRTLGSRVAGLQPDEAIKKRGLFAGRAFFKAAFGSEKQGVALEFLDANRDPIEIRMDMPEMSGIEAAREVLEAAISDRSSDVHIEPHEAGYRVRFRVDGMLQQRMTFEKQDGLRVVASLKTLAQIDVAEKRKAQDGRFRVRTSAGEVDFRVASSSSIYGEKLVLRILDRKTGLLGLTDLGMTPAMMEQFDKIIHSRNGLILATGPTGSGKTSTLYAALSRIDVKHLNVMTIEDPVEYELEGATQMAVNAKAGITYEAGLRSMLRQDPDVIFIGEMRDKEAATIAVRAALTGHLVFSSLHTLNAPSSVVRLAEMGLERYQISSSLLMVVTQRLVRLLCTDCRIPSTTKGDELEEISLELPKGRQIYRAGRCDKCDHTGYQGRTAIFELLILDDALRKAITDGAGEQELTALAAKSGYRPYRLDGVERVLSGVTTVEEILQAS